MVGRFLRPPAVPGGERDRRAPKHGEIAARVTPQMGRTVSAARPTSPPLRPERSVYRLWASWEGETPPPRLRAGTRPSSALSKPPRGGPQFPDALFPIDLRQALLLVSSCPAVLAVVLAALFGNDALFSIRSGLRLRHQRKCSASRRVVLICLLTVVLGRRFSRVGSTPTAGR